jgi:WhiB family transcriptional regulator, redox-sensing transcriptional regulator
MPVHDPTDTETLTRGEWLALTAEAPVAAPSPALAAVAEALTARPGWQAQANCRDLDTRQFFPGRGDPTEGAKAVCRGCVVREACLEFALAGNEKFGIWGGLSDRERRRVKARRRREAAGLREAS